MCDFETKESRALKEQINDNAWHATDSWDFLGITNELKLPTDASAADQLQQYVACGWLSRQKIPAKDILVICKCCVSQIVFFGARFK